jgi:hypothetical protein
MQAVATAMGSDDPKKATSWLCRPVWLAIVAGVIAHLIAVYPLHLRSRRRRQPMPQAWDHPHPGAAGRGSISGRRSAVAVAGAAASRRRKEHNEPSHATGTAARLAGCGDGGAEAIGRRLPDAAGGDGFPDRRGG